MASWRLRKRNWRGFRLPMISLARDKVIHQVDFGRRHKPIVRPTCAVDFLDGGQAFALGPLAAHLRGLDESGTPAEEADHLFIGSAPGGSCTFAAIGSFVGI